MPAVCAALLAAPGASAAPGDLDPTYGAGGVFTAALQTPQADREQVVAIDAAGRALIAFGHDTDSDGDGDALVVGRLTTAGELDSTFNPLGTTPGLVEVDFSGLISAGDFLTAKGVRAGPGGTVLALANALSGFDGTPQIALVRLTAAGGYDPLFGAQGRLVDAIGLGYRPYADALEIDEQGRALVAGTTITQTGNRGFVARYTTAGALDSSWNDDGHVEISSGTAAIQLYDIRALTGGAAAVAGSHDFDALAARLTSSGSLDGDFDGDGIATSDLARATGFNPGLANAVSVDSQGRVVIAGASINAGSHAAVARFTPAGALDTSFGTGTPAPGIAFIPSPAMVRVMDVLVGCGDRVLVVGSGSYQPAQGPGTNTFALGRLTDGGVVDTAFAPAEPQPGVVQTPLGEYANATSLAADGQARAYLAGFRRMPAPPFDVKPAVVRRIDSTGCAAGEPPPGPPPPDPTPPPGPSPPTAPTSPIVGALPAIIPTAVAGKGAAVKGAWLSAASSEVPVGVAIAAFGWDFNRDGIFETLCGAETSAVTKSFSSTGTKQVGLQIIDTLDRATRTSIQVQVTRDMVNRAPGADTVYDCENPGANNQPDRTDCVKTFAFGVVNVNSRGRPEDCFTIERRVRAAPETKVRIGQIQVPTGAYAYYRAKVRGPVSLNGLYLPLPATALTEYDTGAGTIGIGTVSPRFGPYTAEPVSLSKKIEPDRFGRARLASVTLKTPEALGFLQVAKVGAKIDLVKGGASLSTVLVGLPNIFTYRARGEPAQVAATIRADNIKGADLDGAKIGPIPELLLGPLTANDLSFAYSRSDGVWKGAGELGLTGPSPVRIDASPPPPEFGFGLSRGRFAYAGAGADFPVPAARPLLFPGISLRRIGVAVGVAPFRLTGVGGIAVGELIEIDGALFMAFPTDAQPYDFPSEGVGAELAPLSGRRLTSTTLAFGGTASLKVPGLGKIFPALDRIQLFRTHLIYQWPGYIEYSGKVELQDKDGYFSISGGVSAFADAEASTFNLEGKVTACLKEPIKICAPDVGAVISSKGLGFCTIVPVPVPFLGTVPVPAGIGYRWGDALPDVMIFSCSLSDYREAARAAAAAGERSFTLGAGLPSASIRVRGAGSAPRVVLTGPKGERIETPAEGRLYDKRFVVFPQHERQATMIALKDPSAGRWTVTPSAGSARVTSVAVAEGLVTPRVRARVTGRPHARVLHYEVRNGVGWAVTLAERGARTAHTIGVAKGARGTIRFVPAGGRGERRRIVAHLEAPSAPATLVDAGSYSAPRDQPLPRPSRLRARRRGGALAVTWSPVGGAQRYAVTWIPRRGERHLRVVRVPRARFAGAGPGPGRVVVTALDGGGRAGREGGVRIAAAR